MSRAETQRGPNEIVVLVGQRFGNSRYLVTKTPLAEQYVRMTWGAKPIDMRSRASLQSQEPGVEYRPDTFATESGGLNPGTVTMSLNAVHALTSDTVPVHIEVSVEFRLSPQTDVIEAMLDKGVFGGFPKTFANRVRAIAGGAVGRRRYKAAVENQDRLQATIRSELKRSVEGRPASRGDGRLGVVIDSLVVQMHKASDHASADGRRAQSSGSEVSDEMRRVLEVFDERGADVSTEQMERMVDRLIQKAIVDRSSAAVADVLVEALRTFGPDKGHKAVSDLLQAGVAALRRANDDDDGEDPPPTIEGVAREVANDTGDTSTSHAA